mmetsp:Transcript_20340/g.26357  ORF Transcript_20340/g.26357 Transcript_20340/m.26357 type:complete len:351 (+) Transcript_20340:1-1053(+)
MKSNRIIQEILSPYEAIEYGKRGVRRYDDIEEEEIRERVKKLKPKLENVLDILIKEKNNFPIISFCRLIDGLLGGGAKKGKLLEICGCSNTGKSQILLQFCIDVTIPKECRGNSGKAIFIDTDGSFSPDRLHSMATAMIQHVQKLNQKKNQSIPSLTVENILQRISVQRTLDKVQLIAVLDSLIFQFQHNNINTPDNITLLVIDSISSHFRLPYSNPQILSALASRLTTLANYGLAIVFSNQLTTSPNLGLIPALGISWSHVPDTRILLTRHHQHDHSSLSFNKLDSSKFNTINILRLASLLKGGSAPPGSCVPFIIDHRGIRDVTSSPSFSTTTSIATHPPPPKESLRR